jgi:hypothetical protein
VNEFCERRRHTLLSELLLQSLRGEVAQAAERWPVHSRGRRLPQPDHHQQQHQQQEESSTVEDVLLHDPVDAALSLLLLGDEGALEVAFTSSLKVRFVLQPIPAPQTEPAGEGDGKEQEAEEQQEGRRRPWLQLALRTCMLQMYSLLVAGAQSSEAAGKAARGKGPLPASHSSCSLVRAAMDVLRRRVRLSLSLSLPCSFVAIPSAGDGDSDGVLSCSLVVSLPRGAVVCGAGRGGLLGSHSQRESSCRRRATGAAGGRVQVRTLPSPRTTRVRVTLLSSPLLACVGWRAGSSCARPVETC